MQKEIPLRVSSKQSHWDGPFFQGWCASMPPELQINLKQDSVVNWHIKRGHLAPGTSLCCHRLCWERGAPLCRWQESPARRGREVEQNQAAGFWHSAHISQVPSWPCHGLHPSALYSLGNLFSFLTEIEIFLPDMASVRVHVLHSV